MTVGPGYVGWLEHNTSEAEAEAEVETKRAGYVGYLLVR